MCACEGSFVCLRCKADDLTDWRVLHELSGDELAAQDRYDREADSRLYDSGQTVTGVKK